MIAVRSKVTYIVGSNEGHLQDAVQAVLESSQLCRRYEIYMGDSIFGHPHQLAHRLDEAIEERLAE